MSSQSIPARLTIQAPSNPEIPPKEIVFIDPGVADAARLMQGITPGVETLLLDPSRDGLAQIAEALAGRAGLDAIHIISHGGAGSLRLGSSTLKTQNLASHADALGQIGAALGGQGDILLYGCDVAQGESGQAFIDALAQATGADVAASTDLTGAAAQGGDWNLEAATGAIEADLVLSEEAQQGYSHGLGVSVSNYTLAQMSELAYKGKPSFNGWDVHTYTYLLSPGFFAVEFSRGDNIVLAFRGTNIDPIGLAFDKSADFATIGLGSPDSDWDSQFYYAIKTANKIHNENKNANIYVTGHSLGGALAQVTSQMFGFSGATFDPAGAQNIVDSDQFNSTADKFKIVPEGSPASFKNYTVNGSAVSSLTGEHVGGEDSLVPLENTKVEAYFSLLLLCYY